MDNKNILKELKRRTYGQPSIHRKFKEIVARSILETIKEGEEVAWNDLYKAVTSRFAGQQLPRMFNVLDVREVLHYLAPYIHRTNSIYEEKYTREAVTIKTTVKTEG
jgi:hypothetical protein